VGYVFERIEVLVLGGNLHGAAPAARPVEKLAARIRYLGSVNDDLVIVETFILRIRDTDPGTVLTLGQGVLDASQVKRYALSLGCNDAGADAPFGVDRRIRFALLVGGCWLEIFRRRGLGYGGWLRRRRLSYCRESRQSR
jgi:hypothetical protein